MYLLRLCAPCTQEASCLSLSSRTARQDARIEMASERERRRDSGGVRPSVRPRPYHAAPDRTSELQPGRPASQPGVGRDSRPAQRASVPLSRGCTVAACQGRRRFIFAHICASASSLAGRPPPPLICHGRHVVADGRHGTPDHEQPLVNVHHCT